MWFTCFHFHISNMFYSWLFAVLLFFACVSPSKISNYDVCFVIGVLLICYIIEFIR